MPPPQHGGHGANVKLGCPLTEHNGPLSNQDPAFISFNIVLPGILVCSRIVVKNVKTQFVTTGDRAESGDQLLTVSRSASLDATQFVLPLRMFV